MDGRRREPRLAVATIDRHRFHDYALSVLAFAAAARLAVHRGDLKEASRQLTSAMRARPTLAIPLPYLAVRARLQIAKVCWALGEQATARHLLREIDNILLDRPALGVLVDEVSVFRESITTAGKAGTAGGSPLTPAELRLLPYLQRHLTIREIAERLFVSRNTVNSGGAGSTASSASLAQRRRGARQGNRIARRLAVHLVAAGQSCVGGGDRAHGRRDGISLVLRDDGRSSAPDYRRAVSRVHPQGHGSGGCAIDAETIGYLLAARALKC